MSTSNILFFKDWLRRGSWHRLAQTQACRRHQSLEVWRQQLLSLTGYRTRLFKYFSSGKPDPYRAPFAPKHELVCVVQEKESWRHWFAPANRTKESKITFSGGCFKGGRDETLPSCERNKNWFISYVFLFSRHTFPPWCKHSLTACCYKCVLRRLKQLLYVE